MERAIELAWVGMECIALGITAMVCNDVALLDAFYLDGIWLYMVAVMFAQWRFGFSARYQRIGGFLLVIAVK